MTRTDWLGIVLPGRAYTGQLNSGVPRVPWVPMALGLARVFSTRIGSRPVDRSPWLGVVLVCLALTGCTGITHVPQCPERAVLGSTVDITATVQNPGAVPRYAWETFPANAGTFGDSSLVSTTFTPSTTGQIRLQLSAADGLFLFVDDCTILVEAGGVEVSLLVNPTEATVGTGVLFTCTSTGTTPAVDFTITQTAGATVDITDILPGVASFDATTPGSFTFQCVGTGPGGTRSAPAVGTVTVAAADTTGGGRTGGGRTPGGR